MITAMLVRTMLSGDTLRTLWFPLNLRSLSFNLQQNCRFDYQLNGVLLLKVNAEISAETDTSMGVPAVNFTFTRIFWYIL